MYRFLQVQTERDRLFDIKIEYIYITITIQKSTMSHKEITIQFSVIRVFEDGSMERLRIGTWRPIKNSVNHKQGYNVIMIDKKQYMRSRIVCHAFMNMKLKDSCLIRHKDGDKLNCSVSNLSIETHSSISYYRNDPNGWHYDKISNKFIGLITQQGITKRIGAFDTADEAHEMYIREKNIIQFNSTINKYINDIRNTFDLNI